MKIHKQLIVFLMPILLVVFTACLCGVPLTPHPDLKIDPVELPPAHVGVAYEETLQVSQNVTPVYTMSITEGRLPDGMKFEYIDRGISATISGTPKEAGTFKFSVSVACLGTSVNGQATKVEYTLVVE